MHAYCVGELRLSEDAAAKRIQAARTARRFPAIFEALAGGRLHLSAVVLLAPYLRQENAVELLGAAALRTKAEIEQLLAQRYPKTEELGLVTVLPTACDSGVYPVAAQHDAGSAGGDAGEFEHAPGHVGSPAGMTATARGEHAPGHVGAPAGLTATARSEHAPGHVAAPPAKLAPSAPGRFALHVTIGQATHDKLRHAQALLSHKLPSGDLATTLDQALDALVEKLEKRKFAKTDRPQPRKRRTGTNPRHIPAHVKRAVWQRDGGRCTFVSATGHRCNARKCLEFDHVEPVARGGQASVAGVRLRCRAHNQYEAERAFGAGFMAAKRASTRATGRGRPDRPVAPEDDDVLACLRTLGFKPHEARQAIDHEDVRAGATLEDRARAALMRLGRGKARVVRVFAADVAHPPTSARRTPTPARPAPA